MNVAAHGAIAPDRSLFAEMHVADHLSAWIHVRGWVNLRVHPTKRSNHDFADSNTQPQIATIVLNCIHDPTPVLTGPLHSAGIDDFVQRVAIQGKAGVRTAAAAREHAHR